MPNQERPNILFILTDDQGWWDVGAYGNPHIETPHLDRLASEGVRFTHFYATPVCTPTRACLLTGRYFQRTGAIDTFMGRDTMSADEITLAQVLQEAGYRTALVGKWHLGRYMRYHPNQRGFDEFFGFWQYGFINRYFDSDELFYQRERVHTTGYITDVLTDFAIEFVRSSPRPFFLYLCYNAPHSPFFAPDGYVERYLRKGLPLREAQIYGMVSSIDENVGRLLQALDEEGLTGNTLVFFMGDNGGVSGYWRGGLRGNKGLVYEGGIRVPFFVRWPGSFPAGAVVGAMAHCIDLFPTLCDLLGLPLPQDRPLDGKSILPLLQKGEGPSPHEALFFQWTRVRPDPDKNWAIRQGRYKLVNGELYDLETDPGERQNLASQYPDLVRALRARFEAWFQEVTAGQTYERVPIEVGREDENPVEIDVTWGEAVGKKVTPRYERYIRDRVENWTEPNDAVRWRIEVVRGGDYEVSLAYGCPPTDAGSTFRVEVGEAWLEGTVEPTPGWEMFQERVVGRLRLTPGVGDLTIRPLRLKGRELMRLHKIWLRRL